MENENESLGDEHSENDRASLRAAVTWAAIGIGEGEPLRFSGGGYFLPDNRGPHPSGTIGWSFMSWVLLNWLDAGLIEVWAESDFGVDEESRERGWLDRATAERRWLVLQPDDARALLSEVSLWGLGHDDTSMMFPTWTPEGESMDYEERIDVAFASNSLPPSLGEHRGQRALVEWGNAETDWEALAVKWEFPAGGGDAQNPGRIVSRPRLYIVRHRAANGDYWARVLAETEEEILSLRTDVDIWTEKAALENSEILYRVEALRNTVPVSVEQGLQLFKLP